MSEKKITKRDLNVALAKQTAAVANAIRWQNVVMKYSLQEFGVEPSDVDCDAYIDGVTGAGGMPVGMTADEFIKAMKEAIDQSN